MEILKEKETAKEIEWDVEYCIKRHLDMMFIKIPKIESSSWTYKDKKRADFVFSLSPDDYRSSLLSGATIKKWIKSEFDLSGFKISATKMCHPFLTNNYHEYTIKIEEKEGEE